eukprot:371377-Amphidinium_carterae.1
MIDKSDFLHACTWQVAPVQLTTACEHSRSSAAANDIICSTSYAYLHVCGTSCWCVVVRDSLQEPL